jgi:exodeoxyribonuclease V alpha subunit
MGDSGYSVWVDYFAGHLHYSADCRGIWKYSFLGSPLQGVSEFTKTEIILGFEGDKYPAMLVSGVVSGVKGDYYKITLESRDGVSLKDVPDLPPLLLSFPNEIKLERGDRVFADVTQYTIVDQNMVYQAKDYQIDISRETKAFRDLIWKAGRVMKWNKSQISTIWGGIQTGGFTLEELSVSKRGTDPEIWKTLVLRVMEFLTEDQLEGLGRWLISQTTVRQLVLDGLTSKESRMLLKKYSFEEVQRLLRTDPYCILSLSLERVDELVEGWKWRVPDADRELGEVARKLNDEWWESSKAYLYPRECERLFKNWEMLQYGLLQKYDWVFTPPPSRPVENGVRRVIHPRALFSEQRLRRSLDKLLTLPPTEIELQPPVPGDLDEDQLAALRLALRSPITIITGAAGCGKTRVQRELFRQLTLLKDGTIVLGSFTGKAVQRMAELIPDADGDSSPRTLHRLLGDPELIRSCKTLIIDEVSMVASTLLSKTLDETCQLTRLVLVGDPNQISPIAPGPLHAPLSKWLVDNNKEECHIKLTHQHRQDGGHLLNELTRLANDTTWKFVPQTGDNLDWYMGGVNEVVKMTERLKQSGLRMLDCTVLTPYRKIVMELNPLLREIWNPKISDETSIFRVGDRVMITKNSSKNNLYNGMEGIVSRVSYDGLEVRFGSITDLKKWLETGDVSGTVLHFFGREELKIVAYRDDNYVNEMDGPAFYEDEDAEILTTKLLVKSFCITIHKSQGSEWDTVICILPYDTPLATRKLIYTALSRARRRVILFGTLAVVYAACNRPDEQGRAIWPEDMIEEGGDSE